MPIDYKQYHPKWSLIRRLILKRAGNRCEQCGKENGHLHEFVSCTIQMSLFEEMDIKYELRDTKKVILTIAHIDRDRNNNRFSNLKALCQKCHLLYDTYQRVYSFKYGKETQYLNGKIFT